MNTKEILEMLAHRKGKSLYKVYDQGLVYLKTNDKDTLTESNVEVCYVNSKLGLLKNVDEGIRIEPGVYIREQVQIGTGCVFMMGCVVNVGACIGEDTMIDMGAIVGAGAMVGKRCHIGANAVVAGCLEPVSDRVTMIGDDVLIGANATVLEGICVGDGAIVGAGSVVTKDVEAGMVVVGVPARVVKKKTNGFWAVTKELR